MDFKSLLSDIFTEDSEEFRVIEDTYKIINTAMPNVASECKNLLILLDKHRIKLSTIYYLLNRKIYKLKEATQKVYDTQYTRLVKVGRPSRDAIEAEIRVNSPEYYCTSQGVEKYNMVLDLVTMYIKCIDNCRSSTLEILKNIYRVD